MKHVVHVIGARPNFMKVAPVMSAFQSINDMHQLLVHTGQHYDKNMSEVFFRQLGLPPPDVNLEVGSGSHAVQTAQIMVRFEEWILNQKPDIVLVYGDVNSTMAASIVCAKLGIRVAHVEAGLRSFDRTMPEEINRLLTDQIADLLLTPSSDGNDNLIREGISPNKIQMVGNVMIDTIIRLLPEAHKLWNAANLEPWNNRKYALVTLHRPSNVDDPQALGNIIDALIEIGKSLPVIFPVHPRTRVQLQAITGLTFDGTVNIVDPLGYLEFLALQSEAVMVITDSGGIQEETTYLGIPCLTLRENTERPVTVTIGTNILVGHDMNRLLAEAMNILDGRGKCGAIPPMWDGKAGERVASIISSQD